MSPIALPAAEIVLNHPVNGVFTWANFEVLPSLTAWKETIAILAWWREATPRSAECAISLDTVYRTLAALTELGLINRVNVTAGPARYDANLTPHHHFVCTRCGLIRDLYSPTLDAISAPRETSAFGRVTSVEVQLRGVCEECKQRENYRLRGCPALPTRR